SAEAIVFVEAKYHSEIAEHTTHCRGRDQIVRNIDVGTFYAWRNRLDFYFILLASPDCRKSIALLDHYKNVPQSIALKLKHRPDVTSWLRQIGNNLGFTTWDKLH
ncbi:hypothetical protein MUP77_09165, partial [Candidatus Bathyarchaeota archaeon]|nr:hypothetical protein [Candidatus Bathyarchaeota archaeon]